MDTITVRVSLDKVGLRLLVVALLAMALSGSIVQARELETSPAAPLLQDSTGRRFYVSPDKAFDGDDVLTACAAGYHAASLWEIWDPTNLVYDTTLGYPDSDSTDGLPTSIIGWVRTGYHDADGTLLALNADWAGSPINISPWTYFDGGKENACDHEWRVGLWRTDDEGETQNRDKGRDRPAGSAPVAPDYDSAAIPNGPG